MSDTPKSTHGRTGRANGPEAAEAKFWHDLQVRVCRELAGIATSGRTGLWCDGFSAEQFEFEAKPQISGHVWIGVGPREHEKWRFTIVVNQSVADREAIDWAGLLPPNESTGWLRVDSIGRRMAIEPGAAVPIVR